ncbi:MAG: hypothetical protein ACK4NC_06400 [Candidatus Gracilibacteria bacterium]
MIKQLTKPFKASHFEDTYTDKLLSVIKKKAKGKTIEIKEEKPGHEDHDTTDILAMLKKSLELDPK